MILTASLKKTLLVSLAGHIAAFGIVGFSFGAKIPPIKFYGVSFWGAVLRTTDLANLPGVRGGGLKHLQIKKASAAILEKTDKEYPLAVYNYSKPKVCLSFNEDKLTLKSIQAEEPKGLKARESVIMFYPQLPYDASLYFKDRQVVHIELAFNVVSNEKYNSIVIKRKVSSGNLEADLLSMRYISRYLFIQQVGFNPDNWHTVKIDLSTR